VEIHFATAAVVACERVARRLHTLLLVAIAVVPALVTPAATRAVTTPLQATVGPGPTIAFTDADGATITHLDPGTYSIDVSDSATVHEFHLFGPGVNMTSGVAPTGTATWTVTFSAGTYTYQCDPHQSFMHGTFTVGAASPPPPAPSPAPPAPRCSNAAVASPRPDPRGRTRRAQHRYATSTATTSGFGPADGRTKLVPLGR
jgi:plastocyanin